MAWVLVWPSGCYGNEKTSANIQAFGNCYVCYYANLCERRLGGKFKETKVSNESKDSKDFKKFKDSKTSYSSVREKGDYLYSKGDIDGAIAAFETAVQLKPDAYEAHLNLINMYFKKNQIDHAIEACKKIIQLKPGNQEAHVMMANLLRSKGDNKQAIEEFQQAMKLGARDSSIYSAIGFSYLNDGDLVRG